MPQAKLSAKNLKGTLWATLDALKAGTIQVKDVLAITNVAKEITRITNTQLKIATHTKQQLPKEVVEFSEN